MSSTFIKSLFSCAILCTVALGSAACSSSDDDATGDDEATTSGGSTTGTCTGDALDCDPSTLSKDQITSACSSVIAAYADAPGTEYKCDATGLSLTTNDQAACVSTWPTKKGCTLTGHELIKCMKAAKADVCGALSSDGACAFVIDESTASSCYAQ